MEEIREFYLLQKGKNVITKDLITIFKKKNPELTPYLDKHELVLRPLLFSHFESWMYWVISQQLNGRVANILINRFRKLCNEVTPENVISLNDSNFRKIGISKSKIQYLKNIASFHLEGKHIKDFSAFTSEEIREHYTKIRGVGPWTVNMFLIFNLNRLDVLAVNDLVVRKGIEVMYSLNKTPNIKEAKKIGEQWGDLATIGTLLAWEVIGS